MGSSGQTVGQRIGLWGVGGKEAWGRSRTDNNTEADGRKREE